MPAQLLSLLSPNPDVWRPAANDLWGSLCHQHAYVSSAAVPALPFLLDALKDANDELAVEILDILVGFAVCTLPERDDRPSWAEELRVGLEDAKPIVQGLTKDRSEDVSDFAQWFLSTLGGQP